MLPGPSQALPDWRRLLETAFHSPVTIACLQAAIAGSKFPTYLFKAPQNLPRTRSASNSSALPGPPEWAVSSLAARCPIPALLFQPFPGSPLPFRALSNPSGSTRSTRFLAGKRAFPQRPIAFRSPLPFLLNRSGCGSTFQARYAIGGLLFLKPLGTFLMMLPVSVSVK